MRPFDQRREFVLVDALERNSIESSANSVSFSNSNGIAWRRVTVWA
jgi:hypothetical protein